jgi:hypothetical protein
MDVGAFIDGTPDFCGDIFPFAPAKKPSPR